VVAAHAPAAIKAAGGMSCHRKRAQRPGWRSERGQHLDRKNDADHREQMKTVVITSPEVWLRRFGHAAAQNLVRDGAEHQPSKGGGLPSLLTRATKRSRAAPRRKLCLHPVF
jgi:hypothetical protein